jgi:hypothetical protein
MFAGWWSGCIERWAITPTRQGAALELGTNMWHSRPRLCFAAGGKCLRPAVEHSRARLCHTRVRVAPFAKIDGDMWTIPMI